MQLKVIGQDMHGVSRVLNGDVYKSGQARGGEKGLSDVTLRSRRRLQGYIKLRTCEREAK